MMYHLTIKDAAEQVRQGKFNPFMMKKRDKDVTVMSVLQTVCMELGLPVDYVLSKGRQREKVMARQITAYILKRNTDYTTTYIGNELGGLDHTTIVHSSKVVSNVMEVDKGYSELVRRIEIFAIQ